VELLKMVVVVVVLLVWAAVVITAFAISPENPQLVTLATIVTPVMLAVVGALFADLLPSRNQRNRNGR
jgi:drug/metabolite transporter (DMT)-like permease